jgi:hypothetical protein
VAAYAENVAAGHWFRVGGNLTPVEIIFIGMNLQLMLEALFVWGIYPLWLLAGAGDYLCHRLTDIEYTSGSGESWFHLLQFLALLIAFAAGALLEMNAVVFGIMVTLVLAHSVLAHMDVSYTDGRRYISPVEQHIHGFMDVLPLVATSLFGVLHWEAIGAGLPTRTVWLDAPVTSGSVLLVASFAVLSGAPILEELWRTRRKQFERERQNQTGLATIK